MARLIARLRCWWDGFAGTWLDPSVWIVNLIGTPLRVDGHLWDTDRPRFEVVGDREYEYLTCVRCEVEREQGWRTFWRVQ